MSERIILKYNEDDILEILTEFIAEQNGFGEFNARAVILGTPGKDLRMIAIIGELEDEGIKNENLDAIDKKTEYNGTHSKARYITDVSILLKKIKEKDF